MKLSYISYPISLNSICHYIKLIIKNKSPIRIFHNYFLKRIKLKGNTIDLGCGNHSSYFNFMENKSKNVFFADKRKSKNKNHFQIDLEKKLKFKNNQFDNIILFNVIEHVTNYELLIQEIYRITKKNGKLELFVPFMHRYHPDPQDIFRPTHFYLNSILKKVGFQVEIFIIGVGPFAVVSEILLKYFKFKLLKILFFQIFLLLNFVIQLFSKDYNSYYNGIHCTCIKRK